MYRVYIPKYVFAWYASMYALNVTVKILAILTKAVISLAFSEISPEASAKTAKPTRFDIKQMENGEISWIVKTSSTLVPNEPKISKISLFSWSDHMIHCF